MDNSNLRLAENYVLFSTEADDSHICTNPPDVAIAVKEEHEVWSNDRLRALTVGKAAAVLNSKRDFLCIKNKSGRNVHRHILFLLEAIAWRSELIRALKRYATLPVEVLEWRSAWFVKGKKPG